MKKANTPTSPDTLWCAVE